MSTLVTFPRVSLQAALQAHLRALGAMDTETLRYPHAPSVDTVEPLCDAVRAAEQERAELLRALEQARPWLAKLSFDAPSPRGKYVRGCLALVNDVIGRARGEATEVTHG